MACTVVYDYVLLSCNAAISSNRSSRAARCCKRCWPLSCGAMRWHLSCSSGVESSGGTMRRGDETGTTRANAGLHRYAVTCAARRRSRTGPAMMQCSEAAGRFARYMLRPLRPEDEMRWKPDQVASVAIGSRVITPCFPTMREIGEHQQQQQQQQTGAQLMSDSGVVRRVVL